MDGWKNQNVFFVHATLDDSGYSYRAIRLLYHLRRRIGKSGNGKNPGIRTMAERCRMKPHTVEEVLARMEHNKVINIHRTAGKVNKYEILLPLELLYIDHRLDDLGLSVAEFRVLAHMARLAHIETGEFFISKKKFAVVCGMERETVGTALESLEERGLYLPYEDRSNPMYLLVLDESFSKEIPLPKIALRRGWRKRTTGG